MADRPPALPWADALRHAHAGDGERPRRPAQHQPRAGPRPPGGGPEMPGKRAAAALRVGPGAGRRPGPLTARRLDRGAPGGPVGEGLALVSAQPRRRSLTAAVVLALSLGIIVSSLIS